MKKDWIRDSNESSGLVDIMPLNDLVNHVYGQGCFCKPQKDGMIIIHNSLDQREDSEKIFNATANIH